MITKAEAKELVSAKVCGKIKDDPYDDEIVIIDEATMEMSWGWVFFYTSRKYHETDDFQYAIAGNAPILVEKERGKLMETGTAHPVEYYIENYERCGNPDMADS